LKKIDKKDSKMAADFGVIQDLIQSYLNAPCKPQERQEILNIHLSTDVKLKIDNEAIVSQWAIIT
jgi:hypothetical protein